MPESRYRQGDNKALSGLDLSLRSSTNMVRTPEDCEKIETDSHGKMMFYDIKGNTFKNTLIPKETAHSALRMSDDKFGDFHTDHKIEKVHPQYRGYNRSGAILFHNINQRDVANYKTPKAMSIDNKRFTKSTLDRNRKDYSSLSTKKAERPYD